MFWRNSFLLLTSPYCPREYLPEEDDSVMSLKGPYHNISVQKRYYTPQRYLPPPPNNIYPPPFWKWYFSPFCDMSFCNSHRGLFALISPYFAFILPFSFPFSHFLFFFFTLSSFFFYIFPLFLFAFSYFSPKWHRLIFFPGGGYFPYLQCGRFKEKCSSVKVAYSYKYSDTCN